MGLGEPDRFARPAAPSMPARSPIVTIALCVVTAAAAWYLLQQLAGLLKPLLLAVFLVYMVLPVQKLFRSSARGGLGSFLVAATVIVLLGMICLSLYASAVDVIDELPRLTSEAVGEMNRLRTDFIDRLPWLAHMFPGPALAESQLKTGIEALARSLLGIAADSLGAMLVVGVYLLFLLLEARGLSGRLRFAFAGDRAEPVMQVMTRIHASIADFLRAKVKASLVLAIPVTLVLFLFGVKFAGLWGILTFALNFVPYIGSLIACSLPILLAFLDLDPLWKPIVVGILLISMHLSTAYAIEPAITGKAVGLRPLVILIALAFWAQCWGLTGMLLAVPLTAILKIIFETIEGTRPIARLMSE